MDQIDTVDVYGTFTDSEARRIQMETQEDGPLSKRSVGFGEDENGA